MSSSAGVEFFEAIRICFKKYAIFHGRAPRSEYWWWVVFQALAGDALNQVLMTIVELAVPQASRAGLLGQPALLPRYIVLCAMGGVVFLLPGLAVAVRRLHDVNRSGWWYGVYFTAYLMLLAMLGATGVRAYENSQNHVALTEGIAPAAFAVIAGLGLAVAVLSTMILIWCCRRGTRGANRFGPDPLAPSLPPGNTLETIAVI